MKPKPKGPEAKAEARGYEAETKILASRQRSPMHCFTTIH